MFFLQLLDDTPATTETPAPENPLTGYILLAVVAVLLIGLMLWMFLGGRKGRAGDKEYMEAIEALAPGNKIMTTGGLCGVVTEVCDDGTIIVETGSEHSGKSYLKIAKECIYQTDAKGPTQIAREEIEAKRRAEKEAKAAEKAAKSAKAPEQPAPSAQEAPEEAPQDPPAEK